MFDSLRDNFVTYSLVEQIRYGFSFLYHKFKVLGTLSLSMYV